MFLLYITDIEEYMQKWRAAGIAVFMTLAYANDLALASRMEEKGQMIKKIPKIYREENIEL